MQLKKDNNLSVTKKEAKYANTLKKLPLSEFPEGVLQTDHYFLLYNYATKGCMVLDTDDQVKSYETAFGVTTNPLINYGCPRSLFAIEKYNSSSDNVIHYGDKVCLYTHSDIFSEKLYLYSTLISPQIYSRFSRNQEVCVNAKHSYEAAWVIEHPDPTLRYAVEGQPCKAVDQFVIRHCATNRLLASDLVNYYNDYGLEYEMCCNNFLSNNKYQALDAEKVGRLKVDTPIRTEQSQNCWSFIDYS